VKTENKANKYIYIYNLNVKYIVPSLFAVSQIWGVAPRIKIHYSEPSMYRRIRIIRQLEQVSEPYSMMFKELKEHTRAAHITVFLQRKKKALKY